MSHDLADLYRRFGPLVLRRAKRFLEPSEAEEVAHEVFLKLLEDPASFRGDSSPATWLHRVTIHMCLNRLRDRRRRAALLVEHGPAVFQQTDPGGDLEARVFLNALWRTLDEELAVIGVLYYVDGLTTADIGRAYGVTDRTIANRLASIARAAEAASEPLDQRRR